MRMLMAFVTPLDVDFVDSGSTSELAYQPFIQSAMGDSMESDLLPEQSGETWGAATHLDEFTGDLPRSGLEPDLITSSLMDKTLTIVREWFWPGWTVPVCLVASPVWQLVNRFGRASVVSPCSTGDGVTIGSTGW